MLSTLAISGYRSLRRLVLPLGRLTVISGPNGSGKSNVYRALRLLAEAGRGNVVGALAREGGLQSTLWAGPESFGKAVRRGDHAVQGTVRTRPISLRLGFSSEDFGYAIDLGLPDSGPPAFSHDPQIKSECIWSGPLLRPASLLAERSGPLVRSRSSAGPWQVVTRGLASFDSMMAELSDPRSVPEIVDLRNRLRGWRFYDHFRSDPSAPARLPQLGTHTPVLGHDGGDLAAALETVREIGDADALVDAVEDAFPGASVVVEVEQGRFELVMHQHGLLRPLRAAELSDGTLRYLLWIAALLTPRPPELLVLNEPETSLHPDLLPPLARLIAQAAEQSQVIVVSHASRLIAALEEQPQCDSVMLEKTLGETGIVDQRELDEPPWRWRER